MILLILLGVYALSAPFALKHIMRQRPDWIFSRDQELVVAELLKQMSYDERRDYEQGTRYAALHGSDKRRVVRHAKQRLAARGGSKLPFTHIDKFRAVMLLAAAPLVCLFALPVDSMINEMCRRANLELEMQAETAKALAAVDKELAN